MGRVLSGVPGRRGGALGRWGGCALGRWGGCAPGRWGGCAPARRGGCPGAAGPVETWRRGDAPGVVPE
ncbi:hypothetical protein CXF29_00970 [Corynebacterium bovis]|nr:hypothetical protein CXF29_00970 [Corynebacterium bovis]RRQ13994.1 hypothetical protein CXF47_04045 [Corynebacterium bovis]